MIRLQVLGAVDLVDDEGVSLDAVLSQPKRLALLTYLALARPLGFHRREVLLALLWPQSRLSAGRNSLRQALHFLRHALGDGVIIGRGENDIGLNTQLLWCDAASFMSSPQRDCTEALRLYRGDLMPGMCIEDAPEFNRWLDDEREQLRTHFEDALEEEALAAETRSDYSTAVRSRRRSAALQPLSGRNALALMHSLASSGNRAAAIQHAGVFSRALHDELGLEGDNAVTMFATELRGPSGR